MITIEIADNGWIIAYTDDEGEVWRRVFQDWVDLVQTLTFEIGDADRITFDGDEEEE